MRVAVRFRLPTHLRSSAAAGGRPVRDVRRVLFTCSYVQSPIVHASSIYIYIYIYISPCYSAGNLVHQRCKLNDTWSHTNPTAYRYALKAYETSHVLPISNIPFSYHLGRIYGEADAVAYFSWNEGVFSTNAWTHLAIVGDARDTGSVW